LKILFFTPSFYPNTGGLESVALSLARGLSKSGLNIKLITLTDLGKSTELKEGFELYRNPTKLQILKPYLKSDIFFHHNVSLKGIWPLLCYPKKWVILHHITYYNFEGKLTFFENIKRNISRFGYNVTVSEFVNQTLLKKGKVIYNPYNDAVFYKRPYINRDKDFLFVGRLVSDKGCMLLIEAIRQIVLQEKEIHLTIVGDGPEYQNLNTLVDQYQLRKNITFLGSKNGNELANIYNQHHTLVIPSIWKEPFGVVALEGLACGCHIICSDGDGLEEASLGLATTFKKGDLKSLTNTLLLSLNNKTFNNIIETDMNDYNEAAISNLWKIHLTALYEN